MAVFQCMIHRLLNIARSTINYEAEHDYIHDLARVIGYTKIEIDNILRKHVVERRRSEMSTFFDDPKDSEHVRRIGMPYYPPVTRILAPVFRKHYIEFSPRS